MTDTEVCWDVQNQQAFRGCSWEKVTCESESDFNVVEVFNSILLGKSMIGRKILEDFN